MLMRDLFAVAIANRLVCRDVFQCLVTHFVNNQCYILLTYNALSLFTLMKQEIKS